MSEGGGRKWMVSILMVSGTTFVGLVQAGATSALKDIYVLQLSDGMRLGFWSSCKMFGETCAAITIEMPTSPSGAFHAVFFVRYLLLVAAILWALLTLVAIYYCFNQEGIESRKFRRLFRPIAVLSLMFFGGTSLTVSMLQRALAINGGELAGLPVVIPNPNFMEIFLWVSFGCVFMTTIVLLGFEGIFGRSGE